MQAISAMDIKQKSWTRLTDLMRFYTDNVSNPNQAEKLHRTHFLDKMQAMLAVEIKQRSCTGLTA